AATEAGEASEAEDGRGAGGGNFSDAHEEGRAVLPDGVRIGVAVVERVGELETEDAVREDDVRDRVVGEVDLTTRSEVHVGAAERAAGAGAQEEAGAVGVDVVVEVDLRLG